MLSETDWEIRHFIYDIFVARGNPPDARAIAERFRVTVESAAASLRRLHDAHALFLKPGTDTILMAHPLSAIATDYSAEVGGRRLFANCAWDALGIPAMLRTDASICARHPLDGRAMLFGIQDGRLTGSSQLLVHFALPFRRWYDDLVDT